MGQMSMGQDQDRTEFSLEESIGITPKKIKKRVAKSQKKIDIIFMDPPYKEKRLTSLIEKIINLNFLKKKGILIIHRHKKENDIFPKNFKILKKKSYGISQIIFGSMS